MFLVWTGGVMELILNELETAGDCAQSREIRVDFRNVKVEVPLSRRRGDATFVLDVGVWHLGDVWVGEAIWGILAYSCCWRP